MRKVNEYLRTLKSEKGGFTHHGMWKLKSKLCPRATDPPTAKIDKAGNLVTSPEKLLSLYLETYSDCLSHREMKGYEGIFQLKNELWEARFKKCLENKTEDWTQDEFYVVLKSLKNGKSMVNEIFNQGIIGEKLKLEALALLNSIKIECLLPLFMRLANINSIYKSRGSRLSLESDHGIFVLCVLRSILDFYPDLELIGQTPTLAP